MITKRDMAKVQALRELGKQGNFIAFHVANQLARADVPSKNVHDMVKEIAEVFFPVRKKGKDDADASTG